MPISATGNSAKGFTLVELMVVLAILGLALTAVVFVMPSGDATLRRDADGFAARAIAARDLAIIGARPVRLMVSASGYGFAERRDGAWIAATAPALKDVHWGAGTKITGPSSITFDPTGLASGPLSLTLMREGRKANVELDMGGAVHVTP